MNGEHSDIGPELRQLAQTILDRLDPVVRLAAARAAAAGASPGKCQQVWCPVCALAALASGEQHPLLAVIADHSVALLTVVRAVIENAVDTAVSAAQRSQPRLPGTNRRTGRRLRRIRPTVTSLRRRDRGDISTFR